MGQICIYIYIKKVNKGVILTTHISNYCFVYLFDIYSKEMKKVVRHLNRFLDNYMQYHAYVWGSIMAQNVLQRLINVLQCFVLIKCVFLCLVVVFNVMSLKRKTLALKSPCKTDEFCLS